MNTGFCPLAQQIVDYLVDAGHRVYALNTSVREEQRWRCRAERNFAVVEARELSGLDLDYEISFSGGTGLLAVDRLVLELREADGEVVTCCYLQNPERGEVLLGQERRTGVPSAEVIREALRETCIDSIIALSRGDTRELPFAPAQDRVNELSVFGELERAVDQVAHRTREVIAKEDYCAVEDLLGCGSRNAGIRTLEYVIDDYGIAFTATELEWLGLWLQLLLNSRKPGVYGYDLHTPKGKIRKYVDLSAEHHRADLDGSLGDAAYQVWTNKFYNFDTTFAGVRSPGMVISWDAPATEAPLTLSFDSGTRALRVTCPAELPLLGCLREHLDAFLTRLPEFARGGLDLGELTALPESLHRRYCDELNRTEQPYCDDQPIHRLIEQWARRTPDATALVCQDRSLSYRELDEWADRLARVLREYHQVRAGDLVAVYLDRTEHLLVSVLAVLKLGCAYVPLDLDSPVNRMAAILSGSKPKLVLSDEVNQDALAGQGSVFAVDSAWARELVDAQPTGDLGVTVAASELAYVIYTSGTTGNPKGVAVEHRNFVNVATDFGCCLDFRPQDRMLAVTTIAFDISALEIFMPLMHGGTVVLAARGDLLDIGKLLFLIDRVGVTVAQATPSLWQLIVQNLEGKRLPIRALCGGEALPCQLAAALARSVDTCWNVYGPTETTVWSTRQRITSDQAQVTIGLPLANTRCYVLDERMRPVPPGVVGELFIGGAGVARGYLGEPELTARKFVTDPVTGGPDHVYRTGDLVRLLPGGELEFIGRNDFQIKLRGHRIELGEVESALTACPEVEQSLVVVRESATAGTDEGRFLAGYYVAPEPVDTERLRTHLAALLPDYMVPTVLIQLTELPLNLNGKVDRNALPHPELFHTQGYVAPSTELESRLCLLWDEVLGCGGPRRGIGVTDDFFESGGNSILGIKLVNRINSELGSDIKIRDLFRDKTVRGLAPLVATSIGDFAYGEFTLEGTDRERLYEPFPLSNVQQTYYLGRFNHFELSDVSTHVYSEFRYSEVDRHRLEVALNRLIDRHLALRTEFADGQQYFLREIPRYRIEFHELRTEDELHRLRERYSHKVYDPECYPLFDVVLSRLGGVYRLHISFDAIVIDMTSFQILFAEWAQLYHDPELCLPELGVTYRDYVLRYEEVRESDLGGAAREYWEGKAEDYTLDLNLPLCAHPSTIDKPRFKRRSKLIAAPVWRLLGAKCKRYGLSPTALILELYSRVLSHWSGQDRLSVNLTLFNRLPLHPDVNAIIGDFTVLELFDYRADRELGIAAKLRRVHDELLQDIDNNLFDGVDFQRLLKMRDSIPINRIVAPVVLTSTLGTGGSSGMFELLLGDCYQGVEYSISQTSQVWLDNKAYETEQGFVAEWDYVEQLFDESIIEIMHEAYCWLIERVAELDWEADEFPALQVPEADLALIAAANDYRQPTSEHTLISLYESRLAEPGFAQRTAVVDACGAQYSYERVHRDSEALARFLLDPDGPPTVGVLAEKGYLQVLATSAIMKAGMAYVPMNIEWPLARIGEVLAQAGVRMLLVSRAHYERAQALAGELRLLVMEDVLTALPGEGALLEVTLPEVTLDDVAYVIFTSGSTGKPKGVTISHRGAVNTILAVNERFGVKIKDRVLAVSELSFDLSVYDIFGMLAAGGTIVFPSQEDTKNPAHWLELVRRHGVTVWNSVPQLASLLIDEAGDDAAVLASLRVFMLSGDWIPTSLPDKIRALTSDATVMSLGGATEGSIWSIWYEVNKVDPAWPSIPYGVAMPNQGMYVLNAQGEHCPVGVTGEIHIGGMGVALNYWRDARLTAERYALHPELGRLYRTGDLGRWSRDGYIQFLGRNDFQVKLNGYRVELGEIESILTQLPGVDRAVVRIQQSQVHDNLVGYLVPSAAQSRLVEPGDPELDKQEFLLRSAGVRRDVTPSHQLHLAQDPDGYALAKSYRRFLDGEVDPTLLRKHFTEILSADTTPAVESTLDSQGWSAVLGRLAAVFLPRRALPKYRFPSAGGTYPVRTYVTAAALSGHYYHDPLTHQLCAYDQLAVTGNADEIALVVHWPAIIPLYGDRARELALLEVGHMLSLLTQALAEHGIRCEVSTDEQRLDADNSVVCRITMGSGLGRFTPRPLEFGCFLRDADSARYTEQGGIREYDLNQLPVFDRVSDVYAILRDARCAVTLEGAGDIENLVSAGFLFQRLRECLHADGLGTCVLGLPLTERGVYTMVVGAVDRDALRAPEIQADRRELVRAVNEELAKRLPGYMLPSGYLALHELPLNANGKVALGQLPKVESVGGYVPPSSALERTLVQTWAGVLRSDAKSISVSASFFALGGNSLSAMKLVHIMQRDLGLDLRLRDLYQHDTIAKLADHIGGELGDAAGVNVAREEGEL